MATTLDIDSAARISLPESVREEAHLDREVTIVGNDDRLVVWGRLEAFCPQGRDEGGSRGLLQLAHRGGDVHGNGHFDT